MGKSGKEFLKDLQERREYLESILDRGARKKDKIPMLPPHRLRVVKRGNGYQYYIRSDEKDTSGKYVKKNQLKDIKQTIEKEYLDKAVNIIQKELSVLNQYLDKASPDKLENYYENMSEGRKILIDPIEADDSEVVKKWLGVLYEGKEFAPDMPEYYTQNMERVRSKSEIIIANTLSKYNIPYRYEFPIYVKGMGKVYPDFTVLNVIKRKEMYWEHFGLLDDFEYREKAMRKLAAYEDNGIYLGDKLIVTYESVRQPLNVKNLERKITKYLL